MKFSKRIEEIKNLEENKGKIVWIRCGAFFIAVGNDAILLNRLYGLKVSCFKENICKVGVPVGFVFKYLDILEKDGYGYVLYDYDKNKKQPSLQYEVEGKANLEEKTCKVCKECTHYKQSYIYSTVNIDELLEERKARKKDN